MDKEDAVYIYTMEYYSTIKKNEILPFASTQMNLDGIMLNEMSNKERQILYDVTYMECKKINRTSEYNKKEADSKI